MCRSYRRRDGTYFARLCYLTGAAGKHVDISEEQAQKYDFGCHIGYKESPIQRRKRSPSTSHYRRITFAGDADEAIINDMARRYACEVSIVGNSITLVGDMIPSSCIDRALSFGWTLLSKM